VEVVQSDRPIHSPYLVVTAVRDGLRCKAGEGHEPVDDFMPQATGLAAEALGKLGNRGRWRNRTIVPSGWDLENEDDSRSHQIRAIDAQTRSQAG
jgi:hypothetical protein